MVGVLHSVLDAVRSSLRRRRPLDAPCRRLVWAVAALGAGVPAGRRPGSMLTVAVFLWSLLRSLRRAPPPGPTSATTTSPSYVGTPVGAPLHLPGVAAPQVNVMAEMPATLSPASGAPRHDADPRALADALSAAVRASVHRGSVASMLGDDILINYPPDGKRRSSYSRTLSRRLRRRLPPDPRRAKRYKAKKNI